MVTPAHIVPEWYFLPFYAILRSIPDKLGGVVAMGGSIALLLLLPFVTNSTIRNGFFRFIYKYAFWFLAGDFVLLGWLGQKPVEDPYINLGLLATIFYMAFLTVLLPAIEYYETLKKVKITSSYTNKQLKETKVSHISYKPFIEKMSKVYLELNTLLIEFFKISLKTPYIYIIIFILGYIYIQNIIKFLF